MPYADAMVPTTRVTSPFGEQADACSYRSGCRCGCPTHADWAPTSGLADVEQIPPECGSSRWPGARGLSHVPPAAFYSPSQLA
jgi:hypothetical protein